MNTIGIHRKSKIFWLFLVVVFYLLLGFETLRLTWNNMHEEAQPSVGFWLFYNVIGILTFFVLIGGAISIIVRRFSGAVLLQRVALWLLLARGMAGVALGFTIVNESMGGTFAAITGMIWLCASFMAYGSFLLVQWWAKAQEDSPAP